MDRKVSFKVTGMHCSACEKLITEELEEVGAEKIQINYKTGLGSLIIEANNYQEELLVKAVEKAGYSATVVNVESVD